MAKGWIIIPTEENEARRFLVAEPMLKRAKSVGFVRWQPVPERLEMSQGDPSECQMGARVWHAKAKHTLARKRGIDTAKNLGVRKCDLMIAVYCEHLTTRLSA
jgi:hypothetical protein